MTNAGRSGRLNRGVGRHRIVVGSEQMAPWLAMHCLSTAACMACSTPTAQAPQCHNAMHASMPCTRSPPCGAPPGSPEPLLCNVDAPLAALAIEVHLCKAQHGVRVAVVRILHRGGAGPSGHCNIRMAARLPMDDWQGAHGSSRLPPAASHLELLHKPGLLPETDELLEGDARLRVSVAVHNSSNEQRACTKTRSLRRFQPSTSSLQHGGCEDAASPLPAPRAQPPPAADAEGQSACCGCQQHGRPQEPQQSARPPSAAPRLGLTGLSCCRFGRFTIPAAGTWFVPVLGATLGLAAGLQHQPHSADARPKQRADYPSIHRNHHRSVTIGSRGGGSGRAPRVGARGGAHVGCRWGWQQQHSVHYPGGCGVVLVDRVGNVLL